MNLYVFLLPLVIFDPQLLLNRHDDSAFAQFLLMDTPRQNNHGFSFAEIVVVLAVMAIVTSVIISRSSSKTSHLATQTAVLEGHLRHAQALSMAGSEPNDIFGIKCDTGLYWMFQGNNPGVNIKKLFDDEQFDTDHDNKLSLNAKKISISSSFTVFFDSRGIPYSAYTDHETNTPLAEDLNITIKPLGAASPTEVITITQHTGFIP